MTGPVLTAKMRLCNFCDGDLFGVLFRDLLRATVCLKNGLGCPMKIQSESSW